MKTWEMIKKLTENPEKKFSLKGSEQNIVGFFGSTKKLIWIDTYLENIGFTIYKSNLDEDWEEVKEPLTFIELLEKVSKTGNNVKVTLICPDLKIKNKSLDKILEDMVKVYTATGVADIILNAKWYIEG